MYILNKESELRKKKSNIWLKFFLFKRFCKLS
jgi:hypothetical protein